MIYKFQDGGTTPNNQEPWVPNLDYAVPFTSNGQAQTDNLTPKQRNFIWRQGANRVGQVDNALQFLNDRGLSNIITKSNVAGGNANVYGTRYASAAAFMQNKMNNDKEFQDWYAKNGNPGNGDTWQNLNVDGYWGDLSQKAFDAYKRFITRNDNPTTQANPTQAANPTYQSPYKAFDSTRYNQQLGNSKQFFQGWKDYFTDFNNKGRGSWKNNGRYTELVDRIGLQDAGMAQYLRDTYQNKDGTWDTSKWRKAFGRNMGSHNYKDLIRDYSMWAATRNSNAQNVLNTWQNNPLSRNAESFRSVSGLTPGTVYFFNGDNYQDVYSTNNVDWSKGNGVGQNGKTYTSAGYTDNNGQTVIRHWDADNNKWSDPIYQNIARYNPGNIVSSYQGVNNNNSKVFDFIDPKQTNSDLLSNKFGGQLMYKYQIGGEMPQQQNAGTDDDMQQQVEQLVQAAMSGDEEANKVIQSIQEAAQQGDQQAAQMMEMIQSVAQQMQQGQAPVSAKYGAKLNYIARLRGECPNGYHMEYFKAGGRICKKCQKDMQRAARKEKIEKKACGGATKSMNKIKSQMKSKRK